MKNSAIAKVRRSNTRTPVRGRLSAGSFFEALEERKMLSGAPHLLGLTMDLPSISYDTSVDTPAGVQYNHTAGTFDVSSVPLSAKFTVAGAPVPVTGGNLSMHIKVDNNGNLIGGVAGNDFELDGSIDIDGNGSIDFSGPLLTGEISQFGYFETGSTTDAFDFRFAASGGALAGFLGGKDIYVTMNAANSSFVDAGDGHNGFGTDFTAKPQGSVGTTDKLPVPQINILKYTNGVHYTAPSGAQVNVGDTVTWTYDVTNPGTEALKNVIVTDDAGTTGTTADDFHPTFVGGDTNNDGNLDVTETWHYTYSAPATAGQYANTVVVVGLGVVSNISVNSHDISFYNGNTPPPQLGSISGYKYSDTTGNGMSADDTGLGGVVIRLYKDVNNNGKLDAADGNYIATTTTAAGTGAYSFNNLALGNYVVQEVVPNGYIRTGPTNTDNYGASITAAHLTSTGNNFDNFLLDCDKTDFTCIYYVINGCTTVTDLRGNTHQGDTVTVHFTVKDGVEPHLLSFVSYTAPSGTFVSTEASQQQIFDQDSGVFGPGEHTLTVQIPECYYQIDFVCGAVIDHLGPDGSNIFYTPQGRLFSADNGGTMKCDCDFSSLAGNIYYDCNNDGNFQSNEYGIGGATIKLTGTDSKGNAVSLTRVTDSDGSYSFKGLRKGTYKLTEVTPAGYTDGKDKAGSLGGSTSTNDVISSIYVGSGVDGINYNFGEILKSSSISGCVFNDSDRDGCKDYSDKGIKSCKITLTGVDCFGRSVTMTCTTDSSGNYSFTGLCAGTYKLTQTNLSGYTSTINTAGTCGGTKSGDSISNINLLAGVNAVNYLFGDRS